MKIAEIPWDATSCCGCHRSADIPLPNGRTLKIQQESLVNDDGEALSNYVAMFIKADGLLDTKHGEGGVIRGLDDDSLSSLLASSGDVAPARSAR